MGRKTLQRLPLHSNSLRRRHSFSDARLKTRIKSQPTQASLISGYTGPGGKQLYPQN